MTVSKFVKIIQPRSNIIDFINNFLFTKTLLYIELDILFKATIINILLNNIEIFLVIKHGINLYNIRIRMTYFLPISSKGQHIVNGLRFFALFYTENCVCSVLCAEECAVGLGKLKGFSEGE